MQSNITKQASGKASTLKTTFSRETTISISIQADASIIWSLLTKGSDYPRWNSTILSIEGNIAPGQKIKLISKLAPTRPFKLAVKEFEGEKQLVWGDGKGKRVFTLTKTGTGIVIFSMTEKIGGLMFPLYSKYIPSFDASFEQFASDLKKESELIQNQKN